eukprot:COSAG02_NODE_13450_length_1393_cov_1.636785_1_plen_351_part_10
MAPVATVVVKDSNSGNASTEMHFVDGPGAAAARWALLDASRSVTEAWRAASLQTGGSSVEPVAYHASGQALDSLGLSACKPKFTCKKCGASKKGPASKCQCQNASRLENEMRDKPDRAANSQDRELALHLSNENVDRNAGKSGTAPDEPDKIKAGFAELAYHPTSHYHEQQNGRATIRVAVTEDGVTYVSIADFLEFIKVHNRLNAQSMASNLIMDANKKRKYELLHGAINGSKRRTPMIRMADQFPKYVCSIGKLKALNSTLPQRDAATLWKNFCSSSLPKWFAEELEKSTRVDGVLAEWTDEQWAHRTMQVNNGAATVKRSQSTRKRKISRQEGTCRNKSAYRELSKLL